MKTTITVITDNGKLISKSFSTSEDSSDEYIIQSFYYDTAKKAKELLHDYYYAEHGEELYKSIYRRLIFKYLTEFKV